MPGLDFIAANPGRTQVQVADHLRVSPASHCALYKAFAEGGVSHKRSGCRKLTLQAALYLRRRAKWGCAEMRRERLDQIDAVAFQGFSEEELEVFSSFLDRVTLNMTGESENVVSGELFGHLCRELDAIEKEAKKS